MDTKLKKSKPFTAWICFFLGVSIITGLLISVFITLGHSRGNWDVLQDPFIDYRESIAFKQRTADYYGQLFSLAAASSSYGASYIDATINSLDDEGINLKYYAVNKKNNFLVQNITSKPSSLSDSGKMPALPAGYNYFWYFDGQKLREIDHGKVIDIKRLDSVYPRELLDYSFNRAPAGDYSDVQVLLAVRDNLVKNPYAYSKYYGDQQFLSIIGWICIGLLVLGLLLLVFAIINRPSKREYDRKLASWMGRMWLEVKLLLSLLFLVPWGIFGIRLFPGWGDNWFNRVLGIAWVVCIIIACLWWFYLILIDLIVNRQKFFTHNLLNSFLSWYRKHEKRYPWQNSMLKRAYMLVGAEAVLAIISVVFLLAASGSGGLALLPALLIAGAGIYLIYRYLKRYDETISDLGSLMDHIELIKNGDMTTKLEIAEDADIYPAVQNLNSIQEGMDIAVTEMMKSERMKIDLISNVSHDLKTPLTSIISYVDLLNKEDGLPEHVNDYIKILAQKSEHLKNLIQDLFDLSKASSNNLPLDMEKIDLPRLVKQTLADMEEPIAASGLVFRVNTPDEPVYITSDGKKLYRILENLIMNALKYSLAGSRVFIDLIVDRNEVTVTIKNTANYEMTFEEDEILQRFVRGDKSRSSEGSGLGLSIAQTFTEICGGSFSVKIDGDLFKVELRFKTESAN
ncbi:Signal transduction histidine kinase, core [Syntrophomonas zehnderi OL-4]|uniref:histidine kinase n=1 Tax=Syntrophomonas zehnderi OL-4 TaxID=690567 RepID=A0A0E4C7H1_9FIRM|nr:HAMP domain-containing sensor histidine kinase [Syntrophomonas zehnderi]CFW97925.1 Signal transduction histidine kinase, core [Syntrophomonas zehnderi OL-4]